MQVYHQWSFKFDYTQRKNLTICRGTLTGGSLDKSWAGNTLAPRKCGRNFKSVIYEHMLQIKLMITFCEMALRETSHNPFSDESTLAWTMAGSHETTCHYLSQSWFRSMFPYGITGPQWVESARLLQVYCCQIDTIPKHRDDTHKSMG